MDHLGPITKQMKHLDIAKRGRWLLNWKDLKNFTNEPRLIFRCASISWFQAVSGWVSDLPFSAGAYMGLSDYFNEKTPYFKQLRRELKVLFFLFCAIICTFWRLKKNRYKIISDIKTWFFQIKLQKCSEFLLPAIKMIARSRLLKYILTGWNH